MTTESDGAGVRGVLIAAARRDRVPSSASRRKDSDTELDAREASHPPPLRTRSLCAAALATLERFNRGVLLLDPDGAVLFMNRAARSMLNRGHGLALRQRRLVFTNAAAAAALLDCLERKCSHRVLRVGGPHQAHRLYSVVVSALDTESGSPEFVVFVHEPPGRQRPVPASILRGLYGLTAAEARLANALFLGQSLQSAAGAVGVSHNTAKTVLKHVFVKCEVGTQAELLQLLSLGPRTI